MACASSIKSNAVEAAIANKTIRITAVFSTVVSA